MKALLPNAFGCCSRISCFDTINEYTCMLRRYVLLPTSLLIFRDLDPSFFLIARAGLQTRDLRDLAHEPGQSRIHIRTQIHCDVVQRWCCGPLWRVGLVVEGPSVSCESGWGVLFYAGRVDGCADGYHWRWVFCSVFFHWNCFFVEILWCGLWNVDCGFDSSFDPGINQLLPRTISRCCRVETSLLLAVVSHILSRKCWRWWGRRGMWVTALFSCAYNIFLGSRPWAVYSHAHTHTLFVFLFYFFKQGLTGARQQRSYGPFCLEVIELLRGLSPKNTPMHKAMLNGGFFNRRVRDALDPPAPAKVWSGGWRII